MRLSTLGTCLALLACVWASSALAHNPRAQIRSGAYSLEFVDEAGNVLPTFSHRGRSYVLGAAGQRYLLRVRNNSSTRIEVVASVDGRDVIDGQAAEWSKRGYLVSPWGEMTIDGFRTSHDSVAAFRFTSVSDSYAARMGNARDVGVIGVAVFPEKYRPPVAYRPTPYDHGNRSMDMEMDRAPAPAPEAKGKSAEAPSAPSSPSARAERRPGLGTQFGEEHTSHVTEVTFERGRSSPDAILTARYNDRRGLIALGIDVDGRHHHPNDRYLRETADPFRTNTTFARPPPGWQR